VPGQGLDGGAVGDVDHVEGQPIARGGQRGRLLQGLRKQIERGHPGTPVDQSQDQLATDAAARSGDDPGVAIHSHRIRPVAGPTTTLGA
jgi:hypothetical protein